MIKDRPSFVFQGLQHQIILTVTMTMKTGSGKLKLKLDKLSNLILLLLPLRITFPVNGTGLKLLMEKVTHCLKGAVVLLNRKALFHSLTEQLSGFTLMILLAKWVLN